MNELLTQAVIATQAADDAQSAVDEFTRRRDEAFRTRRDAVNKLAINLQLEGNKSHIFRLQGQHYLLTLGHVDGRLEWTLTPSPVHGDVQ